MQRLDEHALRPADACGSSGAAVADPVVDGAARHVQQFRRLVDRDAASKPGSVCAESMLNVDTIGLLPDLLHRRGGATISCSARLYSYS